MREFARFIERLLDRMPPWPDERQWVTIALFSISGGLLLMAREDPHLWNVKLFEVVLQALVLTGLLNMVTAFHFAANKGEREANVRRAENVGKAFDAISAAAAAAGNDDPTKADLTVAPGETKLVAGTEEPDRD